MTVPVAVELGDRFLFLLLHGKALPLPHGSRGVSQRTFFASGSTEASALRFSAPFLTPLAVALADALATPLPFPLPFALVPGLRFDHSDHSCQPSSTIHYEYKTLRASCGLRPRPFCFSFEDLPTPFAEPA